MYAIRREGNDFQWELEEVGKCYGLQIMISRIESELVLECWKDMLKEVDVVYTNKLYRK